MKRKGEFHYVGPTRGMNSLIRSGVARGPARDRQPHALGRAGRDLYQVVGPICESGDVLGSNRLLPPACAPRVT